jgi:aminoglycoside 3-N-acetyltransferase
MLGCGLETNTSMHGVEEMIAPPYVYGESCDYELFLEDKVIIKKSYLNHGFGSRVRQRYERILDLLAPDEYKRGKVLNADCVVYDAKAVWEKGIKKMREDKLYFVDVS